MAEASSTSWLNTIRAPSARRHGHRAPTGSVLCSDGTNDRSPQFEEICFQFDGGAATYLGTALLAVLITVCTLGFRYPFALVLRER